MLTKAASSAFVAEGIDEVDESIVVVLGCNASKLRDKRNRIA